MCRRTNLDQCGGLVSASDQTIAVRATAGDAGWQGSSTPPSCTKRKGSGVGQNRSASLGGVRVDDRPRHAASEYIYACYLHPSVDQRARGNPRMLEGCIADRTTGIVVAISARVCIKGQESGKESLYCTPRVDRLGGIAKTLPVAFELAPKRLPSCRSINFRLQKVVGGREYHVMVLP